MSINQIGIGKKKNTVYHVMEFHIVTWEREAQSGIGHTRGSVSPEIEAGGSRPGWSNLE